MTDAQTTRVALYDWAEARLFELGGDRNWHGYTTLEPLWFNIAPLLRELAETDPRRFLKLWREADYFLWSTGRRYERERLGEKAAALARERGEVDHLIHALYDSIAESRWHRSKGYDEVAPLLDEAEELVDRTSAPHRYRAMVLHYRSRMLRHFDRLADALEAASSALSAAQESKDEQVIGLCENALGNVFREKHEYRDALAIFQRAGERFERTKDQEMRAIAARNEGTCHRFLREHGDALDKYEAAMQLLSELRLDVESAEVQLCRAETFASLGDHEDAARDANAALDTFKEIGAVHLIKRAEELLRSIDIARNGGGAQQSN